MKVFFILLLSSFFAINAHSQVLNGGFEDWTDSIPNHWSSLPKLKKLVHPDSVSHSGNLCFNFNFAYIWYESGPDGIFLTNSTTEHPKGFAVPKNATSIVFWYRWGRGGNPHSTISVESNTTTNYLLIDTSGTWKKFSIPITTSIDSILLEFSLYAYTDHDLTAGTFLFDDISFEFPNAVAASPVASHTLSVSPNPIADHAQLSYQCDGNEPISIAIFDVTGREVLRLPSELSVNANGTLPFDCTALPNGLYYLRFTKGATIMTKKIVVRK